MPVQNHRFPLRRQIVWGMRLFTAIVSLAVGLALFWLSNRYVRDNTLQAAEFNLRLITEAIQSSLDSADDLLNWAAVDSTIRLYLDRSELTGAQTMTAYKAAQEKYLSSPLQTRILRFFITDEQDRFLQFGKPLPNSMALDRASVQLFLSRGYGMALWEDPLLQGHPQGLVLSRPIRARVGAEHRGTVYLGLSPTVITAPATGYAMDQGSALYWEMDGRLWKIEEGELVGSRDLFCEVEFHRLKNRDQPDWLQEATQTSLQLEGREYLAVRVRLEGRAELPAAALAQVGHQPSGGGAAGPHRSRGRRRFYGGPLHRVGQRAGGQRPGYQQAGRGYRSAAGQPHRGRTPQAGSGIPDAAK